MDLRCNKTDCKHNCLYSCNANEVHIAKNTDCKTFQKDANKNSSTLQDVSKNMFEVAPNIAEYKHNEKLNIKCGAKCLFNKQGACNANGITVLDKTCDGKCGTFIDE